MTLDSDFRQNDNSHCHPELVSGSAGYSRDSDFRQNDRGVRVTG